MAIKTKCSRLKSCDVYGKTVVYNAIACDGDKKFNYNGSWETLGSILIA